MGGPEQRDRGKSSVQTEQFEPTIDGRRIDALSRRVDVHDEWLNRLNPRMGGVEERCTLMETSIGSLNEELRLLKEKKTVPMWWLGACAAAFAVCLLLIVITGLIVMALTR